MTKRAKILVKVFEFGMFLVAWIGSSGLMSCALAYLSIDGFSWSAFIQSFQSFLIIFVVVYFIRWSMLFISSGMGLSGSKVHATSNVSGTLAQLLVHRDQGKSEIHELCRQISGIGNLECGLTVSIRSLLT